MVTKFHGPSAVRSLAAVSYAVPKLLWPSRLPRTGVLILLAAAALIGFGLTQTWRLGALAAIGILIGGLLHLTAFGFTGSFRRMIVHRDVAGVQAMIPMLAVATLLFAPVLAAGEVFGHGVVGAVAPLGLSVVAGSFLFGLGMQLGGACGSGTLVTAGGGSPRMVVTLITFCAGSFWASLDMQWWLSQPRLPAVSLGETLGWPIAAALQLIVLAALWIGLERWRAPGGGHGLSRRTWPWLAAALALAVFNWLTLLVSGHTWSITWGFTLWGAKAAALAGWDPAGVWFWSGGFTERALNGSLFSDDTSVMDLGIILGALTAARTTGGAIIQWRMGWRPLAAALIGGLLMGYGARIAFGCNIGAFFSGAASTSLHGWLWIVFALAGTWLGIRLRPAFGLAN
jgi:hypothetical protein